MFFDALPFPYPQLETFYNGALLLHWIYRQCPKIPITKRSVMMKEVVPTVFLFSCVGSHTFFIRSISNRKNNSVMLQEQVFLFFASWQYSLKWESNYVLTCSPKIRLPPWDRDRAESTNWCLTHCVRLGLLLQLWPDETGWLWKGH